MKHWNRHLLCNMKIQKTTTIWTAAMKICELTAAVQLTATVQLPGCFKLKHTAPSQQTMCWIIVNVMLDSELGILCLFCEI